MYCRMSVWPVRGLRAQCRIKRFFSALKRVIFAVTRSRGIEALMELGSMGWGP